MRKVKIIRLFLFVVLIVVFSSCHPRRVSDIRPSMTKEEVIYAWGETDLITSETTDGMTLETWEYHFSASHSVCRITFYQDRVKETPQCNPPPVKDRYYVYAEEQLYPEPYYYYNPYPYLFYYPYPYYFGGYYSYHRYYYPPSHHYHSGHHHYSSGSGSRGSQGGGRSGAVSQGGGRSGGGSRGGGRGGGR